MTGNKFYLTKYEDYDGGFVSFCEMQSRITGKSMSQICDKKNNVLFTDTECLILSSDFKLLDESQVLLRVPRKDNIYSVDLKSVVPQRTRDNIVTCQAEKKTKSEQEYILIPFCTTDPLISQGPKDSEEDSGMKPTEVDVSGASDKDGEDDQATRSEFERLLQQEKQTVHPNSTNSINIVSTPVSIVGPSFINDDPSSPVNAAEASNAFKDNLFE
ncbi:hypothetical protein Tco_0516704 [Tanacetum coccineum]